jgi:hypothetical protein
MEGELKFRTNIPELLVGIDTLEKKLGGLDSTFKAVDNAGVKAFENLDEALKNNVDATAKNIEKAKAEKSQLDANADAYGKLEGSLRKVLPQYEVMGVNVFEVVDGLRAKKAALKEAGSGVDGLGNKFRALNRIPVVLVITLIVTALTALTTLFTRNQAAADKLSQVWAGIKAVGDVLADRLSVIGEAVISLTKSFGNFIVSAAKFLTLDFVGAANDAVKGFENMGNAADSLGEAVSGLNDEIKREFELGQLLEKQAQGLRDRAINLNVVRAKTRTEIELLKKTSEDATLSEQKREAAARKAYALENSLLRELKSQRVEQVANLLGVVDGFEKIEAEINKLDGKGNTVQDLVNKFAFTEAQRGVDNVTAVGEALQGVFEIQEESFGKQTELQNKVNDLRKEAAEKEAARINELQSDYDDLIGTLTDKFGEVGDAQSTAQEKIVNAAKRDIAEIERVAGQLNELTAKLKLKGKVVDIDVAAIADEIKRFVEFDAQRKLDALNSEPPTLETNIKVKPKVITLVDGEKIKVGEELINAFTLDTGAEARAKQLAEQFAGNVGGTVKETFFEKLQRLGEQAGDFSIWQLFGLDADDPNDNALIEGIKNAASELIGIYQGIADERLRLAQENVDAKTLEVNEAQEALETEIEIAQLGFASNVEIRQKELDDAKRAQQEAIAQQKEAQRQQMVLETISQGISLITASANIFKALSPGFPFTLPVAVAAVGFMLGAFIKAKKKAFDAVKAEEGAVGHVTQSGVVVGNRHNRGGVRLEVEGGEFFGTNGRRFGVVKRRMTDKHFDLLEAINSDDTEEIARQALALSLGGVMMDYQGGENNAVQTKAATINVDMKTTNTLLGLVVERTGQRWSEGGFDCRRFGSTIIKRKQ